MASVEVVTSDRILALEAETVVNGTVDGNGNLILTKHSGATVNAGHVVGPAGDPSAFLADANAYTDQAEIDANAYSDSQLNAARYSVLIGTADLDTLVTAGRYIQTSDVESTLARHYPELRAGHLEVIGQPDGAWAMLMQRYTVYETGNPAVWVRTRYNLSWGAWKLVSKSNEVYSPLASSNYTSSGQFVVEYLPNGKRRLTIHLVVTRTTSNVGTLSTTAWSTLGTYAPAEARFVTAGNVYTTGWIAMPSNATLPISVYYDSSAGSISIKGLNGHTTTLNIGDFITLFLVLVEA